MQLTNYYSNHDPILIGVEKNNDDARRNYLSSNHMDAPRDILLTEARVEKLASYMREKRDYHKKDTEYWEKVIFEKRCAAH